MTLLKKIEEKGLKEKEEILKEANAEVNAILSEAKLKAKKEYEKICNVFFGRHCGQPLHNRCSGVS